MISVLRIMNRTTTVIVALIAAASLSTIVVGPQQQALAWPKTGGQIPPGSWLTTAYGDSPDALFFCGAALKQFTGIGAYGCGNGPEGGQVLPWSVAFGPQFPIGIPSHWGFSGWGCGGGFGGGCGGGFGGGCGGGFGGCGGGFGGGFGDPFGFHRHILQDTTQANNCQRGQQDNNPGQQGNNPNGAVATVSPAASTNNGTATSSGSPNTASSGSEDASDWQTSNPGENNANAQTSCLNTGVNTAGHGFGGQGLGENGLGQSG
jgi:hypothetical protein